MRSAASDLGTYCLPMSLLRDARYFGLRLAPIRLHGIFELKTKKKVLDCRQFAMGGGGGGGGGGVAAVVEWCEGVVYLTGPSSWYWLTVGQGLLSLYQERVEGGEYFYFFCFFTFVPAVPLFHLLYYLFYLFSPFLREMAQNDPQGLTCH